MSFADVEVDVYRRELHVILVFEGVGRVAGVPGEVDSVALGARRDAERLVIGVPGVVLQVLDDYAELGAVVARQVVQDLVADPKFAVRIAKAPRVLLPRAIKVDRSVLPLLHHRPGTVAFRHDWPSHSRRRNHVQAIVSRINLGAVAGESLNDAFVLRLDAFELFEKLRRRVYAIRR